MTQFHQRCKLICVAFHFALRITSALLVTVDSSQAGSFCNFVHSLSRAAFASGIFIAVGMGIGLCTMLWCDIGTRLRFSMLSL